MTPITRLFKFFVMKKARFYIIIIFLVTIFTGCSFILSNLYGVRQLKKFNQKDYESFLAELPDCVSYTTIISSEEQYKQVIAIGKNKSQQNDFGQPVQILYFESELLKSFHANCYAKGRISNLNWNTDKRFSTFLPMTAMEYEEKIQLDLYNKIFPEIQNPHEKKYVILIFWSNMLRKVSLSAVETVVENIKQFDKIDNTAIYLINSDNFFVALSKNNSP